MYMNKRRSHRFGILCVGLTLVLVLYSAAWAQDVLRVQLTGLELTAINYIREVIVPKFEEEHGVKVEIETVYWDRRMETLLIQTAAGMPPDIYMSGAEHILELVQNELIYPIDEYWYAWEEADDFFPATLGSSTFKGTRYGVPIYTAPRVWWYRISLFEEAGLDPASPPSTWEELLAATRRLTRYEGDTVVQQGYNLTRFNPGDMYSSLQDFTVFLWQAGGELVDPETLKPLFNSAEGALALDFMLELIETVKGPAVNLPADTWNNFAFSRRAAAIYLAGPWIPADIQRNYPEAVEDVAASSNLSGPEGSGSVVFSDWLGIHPNSPNKELAWRFIQELTASDALLEMHLQNGSLSPRRSTVMDYAAAIPLSRYMYESMAFVRPFPVFPNPDRAASEWFVQYMEVLEGYIGPGEALSEAARLWEVWARELEETHS